VLKELSGILDPRVQETMFISNNIFIMASKSGKLTSNHFETWIKEVFSNCWTKFSFNVRFIFRV